MAVPKKLPEAGIIEGCPEIGLFAGRRGFGHFRVRHRLDRLLCQLITPGGVKG
jgi:hypothetical protein